MAVSGDYSQPVSVNGYQCWNCADVADAKKDIDPAHPKSGAYGVDAKDDPTAKQPAAVTFGGGLSGLNTAPAATGAQSGSATASSQSPPVAPGKTGPGAQFDVTA